MNRAQRRMAEKEARRNQIRLTPDRIHEIKQDVTEKAIKCASEDLTTCFMYVLHTRYGFGAKRICDVMSDIDSQMGRVNEDPEYMEQIRTALRDEVGVVIQY